MDFIERQHEAYRLTDGTTHAIVLFIGGVLWHTATGGVNKRCSQSMYLHHGIAKHRTDTVRTLMHVAGQVDEQELQKVQYAHGLTGVTPSNRMPEGGGARCGRYKMSDFVTHQKLHTQPAPHRTPRIL